MQVWYKYRPDVCGTGYRWFWSSLYLHSVYTGDYTREGLCHNSAVFEAEFLAVAALLAYLERQETGNTCKWSLDIDPMEST